MGAYVVRRGVYSEWLGLVLPIALDEGDKVPVRVDDGEVGLGGVRGHVPQVDHDGPRKKLKREGRESIEEKGRIEGEGSIEGEGRKRCT